MRLRKSKIFLNMHKRLETAVNNYDMIKNSDHTVVALSGRKDSSMLLRLLTRKKILIKNFPLTI